MPDWKQPGALPVADNEGNEVTTVDRRSDTIAVATLEQFDLIVAENTSPLEATFRASEILESIGDAFFYLDEELRFVYVNHKAEKLWKKRREELLGKKFMDVFPYVEGTHSNLKIMQAWEQRRPLTYETVSPIIDRWVEVSAYPCSGGLSVYYRDITERKQAEATLRQRDDLLHVIFDSLSSHVAVLDRAGVITYVSRSWDEFAERNDGPEERIGVGVNYLEVCCRAQAGEPQVREVFEGIEAVIAGERPTFSIEYPCHSPTEKRWFLMQVDPMPPEQGGVVISHVNITERKLADAALRESEEKYRTLFNSIDEGFCVFDMIYDNDGRAFDFIFRVTNPAFDRQTGLRSAVGMRVREFLPDIEEIWIERYGQVAATGEPQRFRERAAGLDRFYEVYAFRVGESGSRSVAVIFSDVTERIRADEALRESEEFNRRIVDSSSDCIKILDLEGRLLYISPRGQELLGIEDSAPYLNGSWIDLWPGEGRQSALEAIERAKSDGLGAFQAFGPTPQGQAKWWDTSITPISDARGQVARLLAISRDITESKQVEESLKSALTQVRLLKDRLQEENIYLREEATRERQFGEIVGRSDAIKQVLRKIEQVGPTGATVLITGETGTGKELVARAIHGQSTRRERPLINVNCAALSPTLIESELFGHERGAFTGATNQKLGRFELADNATIFLDEVGEIPLELQPKLLRVLQEGEFERLGSSHTIGTDVRVIAATNRDLWQDVQVGRFRSDLFYRLNVYPITVPPLRQRRGDITILVEHFVGVFSKRMGKNITSVEPATLEVLRSYPWPGNVRELANVIERAVITTRGSVLQISNITDTVPTAAPQKLSKTLEDVEREHITAVLEATGWKIEGLDGAAKSLALNPSTLRTRMRKLEIQNRKSALR